MIILRGKIRCCEWPGDGYTGFTRESAPENNPTSSARTTSKLCSEAARVVGKASSLPYNRR